MYLICSYITLTVEFQPNHVNETITMMHMPIGNLHNTNSHLGHIGTAHAVGLDLEMTC